MPVRIQLTLNQRPLIEGLLVSHAPKMTEVKILDPRLLRRFRHHRPRCPCLNKEDGGNRKFILVECEDYADTITAERVRRVINGVPNARDAALKEGLGRFLYLLHLGRTH